MTFTTRFAAGLALTLAMLAPLAQAAEPAVIYVVRHGEKTGNDGDPDLTAQGRLRAGNIATILKHTAIRQVFTSKTARTRQTAAPTAALSGVPVKEYDARQPEKMVAELKASGGNTLVVGHSNTIGKLVTLLGGDPGTAVGDDEYDRLYQLVVGRDGSVTTILLSSPPGK
ncbi:histidine phosphatase family protein [Massilia sp. RP-1-19]|uniref:Histidine phosphatase family protein n=1 Tax=Massilia polaris TaxID=2728846 RepID=A0A848HIT2_9BURK|nr:phosphoglycerate mutase family protein [Massilia polaris]NML59931.1 histidine phosphatase family protein [Massilia polaris]